MANNIPLEKPRSVTKPRSASSRTLTRTTAVLEMTQAQTHQQVALAARVQMPRSSLFDYLG